MRSSMASLSDMTGKVTQKTMHIWFTSFTYGNPVGNLTRPVVQPHHTQLLDPFAVTFELKSQHGRSVDRISGLEALTPIYGSRPRRAGFSQVSRRLIGPLSNPQEGKFIRITDNFFYWPRSEIPGLR